MLTELLVSERSIIDSNAKIILANSDYNIEAITPADTVTLCVWIWQGDQDKVLGQPTITLKKSKVSILDTYINFEISEQIVSYIEKAKLSYTYIGDSLNLANSDLCAFVQWKWQDSNNNLYTSPTYLATRGYRWDYERNSFGLSRLDSEFGADGQFGFDTAKIKYNPAINYYSRNFVYGVAVDVANTRLLAPAFIISPTLIDKCQRELYLIVYLDKRGLWSEFTPYGKVSTSNKVSRSVYQKSNRRPRQTYNDVDFAKVSKVQDAVQTITINTDFVDQSANNIIEEIIYSPSIYLIKFKGDFQTTGETITIDSTLVTIDNTNITIDAFGNDPTKYKTFQQIPVICTTDLFDPKTLTNDKVKIDYTLSFETSTSKII